MKLNQPLIFIYSILFFPIFLYGQTANTMVTGKINGSLAKYIELQINEKYLNDDVDLYKSKMEPDGSFKFWVQVEEPQIAKLIYARNETLIYLEPNDTLHIESEANSFQYSMRFSGPSGDNNTCFYEYLKDNPPILNAWQMVQYQKGIFWFANEQKVDNQMQQQKQAAFTQTIGEKKNAAMSKLIQFQNRDNVNLSNAFINYLETEIFYDWAYHLLLYGSVYNHMHQLDEAQFFTFLNDIPLQDKSIGSYWYRNFLLAYVNHKSMQQASGGDEYVHQYQVAEELLYEKARSFVQAHLLYKGFYANRADAILPYYLQFLETNPYPDYDEKVAAAYEKAMRYAVGSPAPDFSISSIQDESISLLDYQGKVVLLNFWASWCRPCMRKMSQLKPIQKDLEAEDIVFVNISLDRDPSAWKRSIQINDFQGVHLLAEGAMNSRVSSLYEVKALPQYFIIDKRGNFAEKPRTKTLDDLKLTLQYLNKRSQ